MSETELALHFQNGKSYVLYRFNQTAKTVFCIGYTVQQVTQFGEKVPLIHVQVSFGDGNSARVLAGELW